MKIYLVFSEQEREMHASTKESSIWLIFIECAFMRPNGPELSCGVTTFINVLSKLRSRIGGARLLLINFLARSEFPPRLQPSA